MAAASGPDSGSEHEIDLAEMIHPAHLDGDQPNGDQPDGTAVASGAMTNPAAARPTGTGNSTAAYDPPPAAPGTGGGGPPAGHGFVSPSFVEQAAEGGNPPLVIDAVSRAEFQTSIKEQRDANAAMMAQLSALTATLSGLSFRGPPPEPPSVAPQPEQGGALSVPEQDGASSEQSTVLHDLTKGMTLADRAAFFKLVSGSRSDKNLVSEAGAAYTELDEQELHLNGTTWRNLDKVASTISKFSKESTIVALVKRIASSVSPGPEAVASITRLINRQTNEMHATVTVNQLLHHDALQLITPGGAGVRREGPGLEEDSVSSHGADLYGDVEFDEHFRTLIGTMPAELAKLYNGFCSKSHVLCWRS